MMRLWYHYKKKNKGNGEVKTIWVKNKNSRWWHWLLPKRISYTEGGFTLIMWRIGPWIALRGPSEVLDMVEEESLL